MTKLTRTPVPVDTTWVWVVVELPRLGIAQVWGKIENGSFKVLGGRRDGDLFSLYFGNRDEAVAYAQYKLNQHRDYAAKELAKAQRRVDKWKKFEIK